MKDKYVKEENILHRVEDSRKYGMIPELLGHFPVIFALDALSEDIMDERKLGFEKEALQSIAGNAKKKDVDAKALHAIIEGFVLDIM